MLMSFILLISTSMILISVFSYVLIALIVLGIVLSLISLLSPRVSYVSSVYLIGLTVYLNPGFSLTQSLINTVPILGEINMLSGLLKTPVTSIISSLFSLALLNLGIKGYEIYLSKHADIVKLDSIIFSQHGLPKQANWNIVVNSEVKLLKSNEKLILSNTPEAKYELCPTLVDHKYYVPNKVTGLAFEGEVIRINYSPVDGVPYEKFRNCFTVFEVEGLPPDTSFVIEINGASLKLKDRKFAKLSLEPLYWKVNEIRISREDEEEIYEPDIKEGLTFRGGTVKINFRRKVIRYKTAKIPSIENWDPGIWVGQEVYGYRVIEVIGLGGNGYVMKVEKNGLLYAMKVLSVNKFTNSLEHFDNLLKESENLEKLSKDPRLVSIYGSFVDKNNIQSALAGDYTSYYKYPPAIIMEFMEGGTLFDLISRVDLVQSKYWQYIVKLVIKEIAKALTFLHKRGYVHLDVKPQNIFLKEKINGEPEVVYKILSSTPGIIKLGDLGSAVRVGEKITQATPAYSPPEQIEAVITGKGAQPSMDNYALGVTLYKLLTMKNLDYVNYLDKAFDEYIKGDPSIAMKYINMAKMSMVNFKPKLPHNTLPELANVVQGTLVVDPKRRLTSYDIVKILEG
ncbi:conserved protein kinase domain protein [Sulfolobus acidocaldarius DSM 639]|uniref:Serine/threonine-protein kinase ArnS n=4 Tax=Sulfolobus acidocaldarius TaxID=2285 RepID=ARNS_SULAC|nr:RecName: Full=Serine/threonine-protein kinase ArnS; Short=Ser/Thr protein kinase ArnS; AltName: Full=Archaellum regulatory network protein ArnS [Sulfolobus acidocaldarius DSM 639]AAY80528.1 conserved protein kinase domain protein [Sulfolobus acidocaldarius DSM 639]